MLGERAFLITARTQRRLVGYCLLISWEDTLYARLAGFDYRLLRDAYEYFNLVIYEPIMLAYRRGLRYMHLGTGAPAAKRRRGAELTALWMIDIPGEEARRSGSRPRRRRPPRSPRPIVDQPHQDPQPNPTSPHRRSATRTQGNVRNAHPGDHDRVGRLGQTDIQAPTRGRR
jgi:hypothetical protein